MRREQKYETAVWPAIAALWRAVRRDLGSFGSIVANNFFLFVAMLMYGAFQSGTKPVSAYPFLALLAFLMLFPLAADPLAKITPARLGLWPRVRGGGAPRCGAGAGGDPAGYPQPGGARPKGRLAAAAARAGGGAPDAQEPA